MADVAFSTKLQLGHIEPRTVCVRSQSQPWGQKTESNIASKEMFE